MTDSESDEINVLYVADEPGIRETTKRQVESKCDAITVNSEQGLDSASEHLETDGIDCILIECSNTGKDSIDFLKSVREEYPNLPFILFTGNRDEDIASEAFSAGVTDYLSKQAAQYPYTLLTNRIENTVDQFQAKQEIEETRNFFSTILEHSSDFVMIVNETGDVDYISPSVERVMGYAPEELRGQNAFEFTHPDDIDEAMSALGDVLSESGTERTVEFRAQDASGEWVWLEVRGRSFLNDPLINGVMVNVRDITKRKTHEQELERQRDRLKELTRFMSHDLKNQLNIIDIRIDMVTDDVDSDHLESAKENVDRINQMIDDMMQLAEADEMKLDKRFLKFSDIVNECWMNIDNQNATYVQNSGGNIHADEEQLKRLLENLFINAINHVGHEVTVWVGRADDGFYVADDGPGIPDDHKDELFESGFSTGGGSGFGLAIVKEIATAHGWGLRLADSVEGGARFEFTDVNWMD